MKNHQMNYKYMFKVNANTKKLVNIQIALFFIHFHDSVFVHAIKTTKTKFALRFRA